MAGFTLGCVTVSTPVNTDDVFAAREAEFHALVGRPLRTFAEAEQALSELEAQRLKHAAALAATIDDERASLLLMRIAEMHLVIAARMRRLPYPVTPAWDTSAGSLRQAFDRELAQLALPLEATGMGIVDRMAARTDNSRFVHRARLYQRLHHRLPLTVVELNTLRMERMSLVYAAPQTLLETGRIGQRSARSH
jgi:hypothetical protein